MGASGGVPAAAVTPMIEATKKTTKKSLGILISIDCRVLYRNVSNCRLTFKGLAMLMRSERGSCFKTVAAEYDLYVVFIFTS